MFLKMFRSTSDSFKDSFCAAKIANFVKISGEFQFCLLSIYS